MNMKIIANICVLMLTPLVALQAQNATPIDRHALVTRHNITLNDLNKHLALGNGEFSFGADGTGLQTFAGNSMSHWGWHSFPLPAGVTADQVPPTGTFQQGRNTGPDDAAPPGTKDILSWMGVNPHIMNLGRLRLMHSDGRVIKTDEVTGLNRSLDLWSGVQTSHYQIDGSEVTVETCVHPSLDMVAVRIESPLVESGELQVALDFAYPSFNNGAWVGDFNRTTGHSTVGTLQGDQRVNLVRKVDAVTYYASLMAGEGSAIRLPSSAGTPQPENATNGTPGPKPHDVWTVSARGSKTLSFVCAYSADPLPDVLPSAAETKTASAAHWKTFWSTGGAIDLSGSSDPRWFELERRIVLSEYLMAAMSAGSWPSSENGLMGIDPWHGRFHMEMVWWHLAHYALWDRWDMADKAIGCYQRFTPVARELAEQLDYKGLKWGKSVGPDGRTAPWRGNQVLLWKQPHPIFFAELDYRLHPTRATLEKWADIVQGSAENMADYPTKDEKTGIYHLTYVMPPSETGIASDTVFDLAYWRWGLDKAQEWRERMGLARVPLWDEVRRNLAPLPVDTNGFYMRTAQWNDTYTTRAHEHPDPVGVLGMLPPMDGVDPQTAQRTVSKVWTTWNWNDCWGWDFPWIAMAAARTGQPEIAVDALLKNSDRNNYATDGMCGGWYLPGNGGLLYATAMMAAGWDGAPDQNAPGFPKDGKWVVRWEDLKKAP
jgi:hypothetical protein